MLLLPAPKKTTADVLREAQERLCADVARFQKLFQKPLLGFDPGAADFAVMVNFPLQGYQVDMLKRTKSFMQMWGEHQLTGGFRPGELTLFAARRPSENKTLIGQASSRYRKETLDAAEQKAV